MGMLILISFAMCVGGAGVYFMHGLPPSDGFFGKATAWVQKQLDDRAKHRT